MDANGGRWRCPCGDVYRVGEGETLQTISAKCHAPLLLLDNLHIQDADDVSPRPSAQDNMCSFTLRGKSAEDIPVLYVEGH
ncbi:hypothetical protein KP509_1Z233900 [Ceratopteris richardii]|nr:hypothetical protein KP509_1Z233900 [Ceratopteris richardii]